MDLDMEPTVQTDHPSLLARIRRFFTMWRYAGWRYAKGHDDDMHTCPICCMEDNGSQPWFVREDGSLVQESGVAIMFVDAQTGEELTLLTMP